MIHSAFSLISPDNQDGIRTAADAVMTAATQTNSVSYFDAVLSTPTIAFAMLATSAAMVLGVAGPSSSDQYSIIGALCALAIVIVHVRKIDPTIMNTVAVVAGSLVLGVAGPGFTVSLALWKQWIPEQTVAQMTFHSWLLMGFFWGLSGWAIAQGFYLGVLKHLPDVFTWLFSKIPFNNKNP